MGHTNVLSMHRFYASAPGQQAAELIGNRILQYLPPVPDQLTVGLGYCLPYLEKIGVQPDVGTSRTLAFMPARQGVCHWPEVKQNKTCLVDPLYMPLADSSVDRMLLVHALEHVNRPSLLLREIWRILAPGGHLVVVVPNRLREWSAAEATPFGHGRPYSRSQIFSVMAEQMLPPDDWGTVLTMPPMLFRYAPRLMRYGEKLGGLLGRHLGGVLVVYARKQMYGALPKGATKARTVPVLTHAHSPRIQPEGEGGVRVRVQK